MAAEDFVTGQDVFNAVMESAGQGQSLTDQYATTAKMAIMQEYKSLLAHDQWYWAKAPQPAVLTTKPRLQVIAQTIVGNTVTLLATITPSVAGRKFYVNANQAYYRILAHTDGTNTLTLDASYVETQPGGPATIYQDEYALAATCLTPWTPFRIRGQWERDVEVISEKEFRARYGWSTTTAISIPEAACVLRTDLNQVPVVMVAPWPTDAINVEYDWVAVPPTLSFDGNAANDTPIIPAHYRWVLYQRALSQLFATKNDDLSERAWKRAELGLAEMVDKFMRIESENRLFCRPRHGLGVA